MFDERSEKWFPAGLEEFHVTALGSHQSYLYAATDDPEPSIALQSRPCNPTQKPHHVGARGNKGIKRPNRERDS